MVIGVVERGRELSCKVGDVDQHGDPARERERSRSRGSVSGGPMMSVTMRARSTFGDVSGSISCETAGSGGQTLSWNMEPDSEARAHSRRGGVNGDEGGGDKGAGTGM